MIGHVIMEIEPDEMRVVMAFYLNKSVFNVLGSDYHKAVVTEVRQRGNGNFVIEFDGRQPAQPAAAEEGTNET